MSRVDAAWNQVSGAVVHNLGMAPRAQRPEQHDEGALHHYPLEAGASGNSGAALERLSRLTVVPPQTAERRQPGTLRTPFERKLVVSEKAPPVAVEQYSRVAATMLELHAQRGVNTLMVTSAVPNEGKTLTVCNLALTLSESFGRRVLLIDADLRRPSVHEVFRLPNQRGLSDVLCSEGAELPLLEVSKHFSVLPAGRPDQRMAGLTSDRMRMLLEQCAERFDWVLLDGAPIGFMPDAQVLARLTRAVLFVIAAHSTQYEFVSRAIGQLDPECVVGVLLNGVKEHNIPAARYCQEYCSPSRLAD
jgi:capsular exopolysaccharide synthesis family protein